MENVSNLNDLIYEFQIEFDSVKANQHHYYDTIYKFFNWVEVKGYNWRELRISHIIMYKNFLEANPNKPNFYIFYHLIIIKLFFKWFCDKGIYEKNISDGLRLPKYKILWPLSPDEIERQAKHDHAVSIAIENLLLWKEKEI